MYRSKNKNKNIDKLTTVIGICISIATLPQLYRVLTADNLQGVSFITWFFYALQAGVFAAFGIKHKEKPLIITYVPLFIIEVGIVLVLLFRGLQL